MATNKWRVYIKPLISDGVYGAYQEVTRDVDFSALARIEQNLDNTQYDIGIYRNNNVTLRLDNRQGFYSDVTHSKTIFKYARGNSLVKITWEIEDDGADIAGTAIAGHFFASEETTVFVGLLNDETAKMDLTNHQIEFSLVGRESVFDKAIVPIASITDGVTLLSEVIYASLNQSIITSVLNVSALNIALGVDVVIDAKADLENVTVRDMLNDLLLISNSVLKISDDDIVISGRDAASSVSFSLYGQGSKLGEENIASIMNIRSGLNRVFNYISWSNAPISSVSDEVSTGRFGVRARDLSFSFLTNPQSISKVIGAIQTSFSMPRQEMDLTTPLNYDTLALGLLNRVQIDYPVVLAAYESNQIPVCGFFKSGVGVLPKDLWGFRIGFESPYKIIGRSIDMKNAMVLLKLRAI
jgi:hypothetical protein